MGWVVDNVARRVWEAPHPELGCGGFGGMVGGCCWLGGFLVRGPWARATVPLARSQSLTLEAHGIVTFGYVALRSSLVRFDPANLRSLRALA